MRAWRVVNRRYLNSAFSGDAIARVGGRWSRPGQRVVYCASNKPLAVIELRAASAELMGVSDQWVAVAIEIPLAIGISSIQLADLPPDWQRHPPPPELAQMGARWLAAQESAVLEVPSVILPGETNLLLNPTHRAFSRLQIGAPEPLELAPMEFRSKERAAAGSPHRLFICHASEDKQAVVDPIVSELRAARIPHWYDQAEIKVGDSISRKIQEGLKSSEYVLVVLSETFLRKQWPRTELGAALAAEAQKGRTVILPLLVGDDMARQRILERLPLLGDKRYLRWNGSPEDIVAALLERLLPTGPAA